MKKKLNLKEPNNLICDTFDLFSVIISDGDLENESLRVWLLHVQPVDFFGVTYASRIVQLLLAGQSDLCLSSWCCSSGTVVIYFFWCLI